MVCVVRGAQAQSVLRSIKASGHSAWILGEVVRGKGRVQLL